MEEAKIKNQSGPRKNIVVTGGLHNILQHSVQTAQSDITHWMPNGSVQFLFLLRCLHQADTNDITCMHTYNIQDL